MLSILNRTSKPKSLKSIADSIFNGKNPPLELQQYIYRKHFGLSASDLDAEPVDQFFTNLTIYAYIQEKERLEQKNARRTN